jgi:hypothetical protein
MALQISPGEIPYFSSIWGYLWIPRPQNGLGMTPKYIFPQAVKAATAAQGTGTPLIEIDFIS